MRELRSGRKEVLFYNWCLDNLEGLGKAFKDFNISLEHRSDKVCSAIQACFFNFKRLKTIIMHGRLGGALCRLPHIPDQLLQGIGLIRKGNDGI